VVFESHTFPYLEVKSTSLDIRRRFAPTTGRDTPELLDDLERNHWTISAEYTF
jgi:hypothetical protein